MVEAGGTRSAPVGEAAPSQGRGVSGWRWGIVSLAVVVVILGGTIAAHSLAARLRYPPTTPAPSLPPLAVVAVTAPGTDYEVTALDASLGHVVALVADRQPQCPPQGSCPAVPDLTRFVVLDGATGQVLATTVLTGSAANAAHATYLLVDEAGHVAYAVAPGFITAFSTKTGSVGTILPWSASGGTAALTGAVFDAASQRFFVVQGGELLAIRTGADGTASVESVDAAAGPFVGVALDARDGVAYSLHAGSAGQGGTLYAFDAETLALVGQAPLAVNAAMGPVDPATGALSLLGADGHTYRAALAGGQISVAVDGPVDALALGWNAALSHSYVAHDDDVQVLDASGKAVAALPLRIYGGTALLVDAGHDLLYLTGSGGSLVIARDGAGGSAQSLNVATAVVLARAALGNYLPDTNQDPAFLDGETFWPGATSPTAGGASATHAENFWIHFVDRGWTGPYAGSAETSYVAVAGSPGSSQVTFTITWEQLFQRSHSWTLEVAPDGAVAYVSDGGDAVP